MNRQCAFCGGLLWPDPPEGFTVQSGKPYCNENHAFRHKYKRRRKHRDEPRWKHECPECERAMFAPAGKSGWYCPECDLEKPIDTSYWEWLKQENKIFGNGSWDFEPKCPNCDEWQTYLFDGSLQCHNCELWITQYGREWWAWLEQEFPSKEHELHTQDTLA